jgi:hypothetical protein
MTDAAPPTFAPDVVAAICRHMNEDHPDDCVRMVHGLGGIESDAVTMTGLDDVSAFFTAATADGPVDVVLPWSHRLTDRGEVRTEVVAMHELACRNLGIEITAGEGH